MKAQNLRAAYDTIMELQLELQGELITVAAKDLLSYPHFEYTAEPHHSKVKALAATFELQDFLAGAIAEAVAKGELEPELDD